MPTVLAVILAMLCGCSHPAISQQDPLKFRFSGKYGQVEVGGRYAGVEFHRSRPIPSRISFYYPVANSIDVSMDYWKREEWRPMGVGIKVGEKQKRWVGEEPWEYTLSPHTVSFASEDEDLLSSVVYAFCADEPAFVFTLTLRNKTEGRLPVEVYTHLLLSIRTSHTFTRKDSAWTEFDAATNAVIANYDDPQTNRASVFVLNAGLRPEEWTSTATDLDVDDRGASRWIHPSWMGLRATIAHPGQMKQPVAAFIYRKELQPGDSLQIVQVIGSSTRNEVGERIKKLFGGWRDEIAMYDRYVRSKASTNAYFVTGDAWLDRSAIWSRALLASNAHFLDGDILPMPCPAEYNFFFTHDMLLTDLAAVNFDPERVRQDLLYLAMRAEGDVIPHAYYWKDDGYKKELCGPDNWNHFWFIIVSASYLRHSADTTTGMLLYPLLTKSVQEILKQRKDDGLVHARSPDWWDIGNNEGPRSYGTILTIRALREYCSFSVLLGRAAPELGRLELEADGLQQALNDRLWDDENMYLMNKNSGVDDDHYYAGSLLGAVYGLLDGNRAEELVATAARHLVDPRLGTRTVAPTDFHVDSVITYFKLAGNEAGQPSFYINGGVWPHTTAWYIQALQTIGRSNEAYTFLRNTMTLDGIANSPNGQPALYEYRFTDSTSEEYGSIDKPSFLWAGGKFLEALYTVFGVREHAWNLSFVRPPAEFDTVRYSLSLGALRNVIVTGGGRYLESLSIGGVDLPSSVLPLRPGEGDEIRVRWGDVRRPYVSSVNAILRTAEFNRDTNALTMNIVSFPGHRTSVEVVSMIQPHHVLINGLPIQGVRSMSMDDGTYEIHASFTAPEGTQRLKFQF